MRGVDDLRELLAADDLLEHPHLDLAFKGLGMGGCVRANDARDRGAPVAGADQAHLLPGHRDSGKSWRGDSAS